MNDYTNSFLLANIFIDVLLNGKLFPAGAYVYYLSMDEI